MQCNAEEGVHGCARVCTGARWCAQLGEVARVGVAAPRLQCLCERPRMFAVRAAGPVLKVGVLGGREQLERVALRTFGAGEQLAREEVEPLVRVRVVRFGDVCSFAKCAVWRRVRLYDGQDQTCAVRGSYVWQAFGSSLWACRRLVEDVVITAVVTKSRSPCSRY